MCGWIGVEISKSRVRTPGKAGCGLYRVRGSILKREMVEGAFPDRIRREWWDVTEWTAYAFSLSIIENAVAAAIEAGRPESPGDLHLVEHANAERTGPGGYAAGHVVPTRWTQQYRGRRDLGVSIPVAVKPEFAAELDALAALVGEGLIEMRHVSDGMCGCDVPRAFSAVCVRLTMGERCPGCEHELRMHGDDGCWFTVSEAGMDKSLGCPCSRPGKTARQRQREANAAFQAEHAPRRAAGKAWLHARKLSRGQRREE